MRTNENKQLYQYQMNKLTLTLLALLLLSVSSIRVLKGDQIPKDYPIGQMGQVQFTQNGRIFFQAMNGVYGYIDEQTGKIVALYMLEADEKVVESRSDDQIVIAKGKQLNIFSPKDDKYIRLQASDFLEKQTFNKFVAYKRFFMMDYILTDKFLLKAHNPYASLENPFGEKKKEQYEILAKEKQGQELFQIIFMVAEQAEKGGVGLISLKNGKKQFCLQKLYFDERPAPELCYTLDPTQQFQSILDMGQNIIVVYKQTKVILDLDLKKIKQAEKQDMITFVDSLNIIGAPNSGKNLNTDQEGRTILFFDMGNPNGANNVVVYAKYMLVKKNDKVIANIPLNENQQPLRISARSSQGNKGFVLVVQFKDGSIQTYKIDEEKKTFTTQWTLVTKAARKIDGGTKQEAERVSLHEQEEIIQNGEAQNEKQAKEFQEQQVKEAKQRQRIEDQERKRLEAQAQEQKLKQTTNGHGGQPDQPEEPPKEPEEPPKEPEQSEKENQQNEKEPEDIGEQDPIAAKEQEDQKPKEDEDKDIGEEEAPGSNPPPKN